MNAAGQFEKEVADNIKRLSNDPNLPLESLTWMIRSGSVGRYSYNFRWLGRPIIQYPQDMVAMQELIWLIKPDLIIETGIAHGGSLILSASMLAMLDICQAIETKTTINPAESCRRVLGIDIDIRQHNRQAIESHPMASRIQMIQGSSVAPEVVAEVKEIAKDYSRILVCLDSNHTHDHVLGELEAYTPFVTKGSYCVVFDTIIEDVPPEMFADRPWGPGNNPKTAVREFLKSTPSFEADESLDSKLLISVARNGYLRRIK